MRDSWTLNRLSHPGVPSAGCFFYGDFTLAREAWSEWLGSLSLVSLQTDIRCFIPRPGKLPLICFRPSLPPCSSGLFPRNPPLEPQQGECGLGRGLRGTEPQRDCVWPAQAALACRRFRVTSGVQQMWPAWTGLGKSGWDGPKRLTGRALHPCTRTARTQGQSVNRSQALNRPDPKPLTGKSSVLQGLGDAQNGEATRGATSPCEHHTEISCNP